MTVETPVDARGMIENTDFRTAAVLASGVSLWGIFMRDQDLSLEVNGRSTHYRVMNNDVGSIAIGDSLAIENADYIVREKQPGDRTTVLVLEVV